MTEDFLVKKEQLYALSISNGLTAMLEKIAEILGNPVLVIDTSYNLLAYTENKATDDWLWNEIIQTNTFSDESVAFFKRENFIKVYAQSEVVSLMTSEYLPYARFNGKLFDKENVQRANLVVVACYHPFTDTDMALVETACEALSAALQASNFYQSLDSVYQSTVISDILDDHVHVNKKTRAKLAELYRKLKSNIYVAVADITEYEDTLTHLGYFRDIFKKIQPQHLYYVYFNNIFILLSTNDRTLDIQKDLKELASFFLKHQIYAGISSKFQDLKDLKKHYREALIALNYGLKEKRGRSIFHYDAYRLEHFLQSIYSKVDISALYHHVILAIKEYDRENHTSWLDTLCGFLAYGMNLSTASQAMGITLAECQDRIRFMEDTFHIDFNNGDLLASVYISAKILNNLE